MRVLFQIHAAALVGFLGVSGWFLARLLGVMRERLARERLRCVLLPFVFGLTGWFVTTMAVIAAFLLGLSGFFPPEASPTPAEIVGFILPALLGALAFIPVMQRVLTLASRYPHVD
ncbi:MAG: hypothetical protein M0R77_20200 [Gammaproteobacteria bacterium]|nr:hypothetical protein [Gammaproteobacteria bacterium]